jgi:hypothetical protein
MTLQDLLKLKEEDYESFLLYSKTQQEEWHKNDKNLTTRKTNHASAIASPDYKQKISGALKGRKITWAKEISKNRKENGNNVWSEERRKKHSEERKSAVTEEFKQKIRDGIKNSEAHKKAAAGNAERNKTFMLKRIYFLCDSVNEIFSLKEAFDNTEGKVPSIRSYLKNTEFFKKISGGKTADKVIYKRLKFPDEIYRHKM